MKCTLITDDIKNYDKLISSSIECDLYKAIYDIVHVYTQYIIFELKLKDYINNILGKPNIEENRDAILAGIEILINIYKNKMPFATLIEELRYLVKIAITDILYKKDLQKRVEKNL